MALGRLPLDPGDKLCVGFFVDGPQFYCVTSEGEIFFPGEYGSWEYSVLNYDFDHLFPLTLIAEWPLSNDQP